MFKIEKGVPMLPRKRGHRAKDYPFSQMSVGDSFFVKGVPRTVQNRLASSKAKAQKNLGFKFATRTTDDGVRCWRIA